MATKRAIVNYGGALEEMRTGDTLYGAGSGGGGNAFTATVDFGTTGDTDATVTVTGLSWILTSSIIVCTVVGEDAAVQSIQAYADNIVDGVGCDIIAHAPDGADGTFTVNCIGV